MGATIDALVTRCYKVAFVTPGSAAAGAGGVGLGWLGVFGLLGAAILGDVDQVRGGVVSQQAARAELDVREARRVEPASTAFAEVDDGSVPRPP
jgi:hypothetical protein